jgi:hypothetical protein
MCFFLRVRGDILKALLEAYIHIKARQVYVGTVLYKWLQNASKIVGFMH